MSAWNDLIMRYRRLNGMTQSAFAELIGVEQATVSRWERGFHTPDLATQRKLRDLLVKRGISTDTIVMHRVRTSIVATKLADQRGRNLAASCGAAAMHGIDVGRLQTFDYSAFHTDVLDRQWLTIRSLGFFRGDVASVHVFNTWQPACGGTLRYCEGRWTPAFLSDGEVVLHSEFREIDVDAYSCVLPHARLHPVMLDELLG